MCSGGNTLGGRTCLHVFSRGNSNIQIRDDTLDIYVRHYVGTIGDAFVLQVDNVRSRRTRILDANLEQEKIKHLQWPARSPDLNLIKHAWDAVVYV
ncbi:transposable element Tcb2 transposase [Trichonephila clavipes]|nr:transposable element Tcb2 transposase [Trichonephila clavipes]